MKLFKDLLKNRESIVFNEIRKYRQLESERKSLPQRWEDRDYKIYPSDLSFSMCPWKYFQTIDDPRSFNLSSIYKMTQGEWKHRELQDTLLKANLLYEKPNITDPMLLEKLDKFYPEVPFFDGSLGISGRIDAVINHQGNPVAVEIKTTSLDPKTWESRFESVFPTDKHICQLSIYLYYLNLHKYYDKPLTKGILAYYNTLIECGKPDAEREIVIPYTQELQDTVSTLVQHLKQEKELYLAGIESECKYPGCKDHYAKPI